VRNDGRQLLCNSGTLFRNNVGINPAVYSPKHPYFATLPEDLMIKIKEHSET
jgi:hypothetical protein